MMIIAMFLDNAIFMDQNQLCLRYGMTSNLVIAFQRQHGHSCQEVRTKSNQATVEIRNVWPLLPDC